jgi:Protein of unknown function (DUF3311)
MKRALLVIMVGALYALHQDFWFWRTANPLVFGFIPIGLFYHAVYTLAVAFVMWILVRAAWPAELEGGEGEGETGGGTDRRPVTASPRRPSEGGTKG